MNDSDELVPIVRVPMSEEEIKLMIETLEIAKVAFSSMIDVSTQHKDQNAARQILSRLKLCNSFILKFAGHLQIGEPTSGTIH